MCIRDRGFKHSRMFLLFTWLFLGNILSMAYRGTLLSTLIPIRYEKALDTIDDLDKSGLGLGIPGDTVGEWLVASDPRPAMRRINARSEVFLFSGTIPKEVDDR